MSQSEISSQETENPGQPTEDRQSLYDLLEDRAPESQDGDEGEGGAPEKASKATPIKGLKDLAETLGKKPEDLYSIEVPMADGESMTIGKMKDLVKEQESFRVRELEFEETQQKAKGELTRAEKEVQELISLLPKGAVKPEVLQAIASKRESKLKMERELTLKNIPEWRDESARTAEIGEIVEHLADYGFDKDFLLSVDDHRVFRYIRDSWLRERRVRRALEQVGRGKPPKTAKGKTAGPVKKSVGRKATGRGPQERMMALLD